MKTAIALATLTMFAAGVVAIIMVPMDDNRPPPPRRHPYTGYLLPRP